MRKALIAGATGAIGSVLLELLDDSDQCHHGTRFTGFPVVKWKFCAFPDR
jgi:aspartate-semialdehyde dehydrogenase